mmetsp:Transcript_8938/g.18947  ORF Transcript_8938/g.18947 Transcript_8938/m.18947 type:complete len:84 (-) Transcript_8938:1062-1313(-)
MHSPRRCPLDFGRHEPDNTFTESRAAAGNDAWSFVISVDGLRTYPQPPFSRNRPSFIRRGGVSEVWKFSATIWHPVDHARIGL